MLKLLDICIENIINKVWVDSYRILFRSPAILQKKSWRRGMLKVVLRLYKTDNKITRYCRSLHYAMVENHQCNFKMSPWRNHEWRRNIKIPIFLTLQEIHLGYLVETWVLHYQKDNWAVYRDIKKRKKSQGS